MTFAAFSQLDDRLIVHYEVDALSGIASSILSGSPYSRKCEYHGNIYFVSTLRIVARMLDLCRIGLQRFPLLYLDVTSPWYLPSWRVEALHQCGDLPLEYSTALDRTHCIQNLWCFLIIFLFTCVVGRRFVIRNINRIYWIRIMYLNICGL